MQPKVQKNRQFRTEMFINFYPFFVHFFLIKNNRINCCIFKFFAVIFKCKKISEIIDITNFHFIRKAKNEIRKLYLSCL